MFWSNLFNQGSKIQTLTTLNDYLNAELDKTRWKVEALEKELRKSNASKERILLRYADQVSIAGKLPQHFVADSLPVVLPEEPKLSADIQQQIRELAETAFDNDKETGNEKDLSWYIESYTNEYLENGFSNLIY